MTLSPFFPSLQAYRLWMTRMPRVASCQEDLGDPRLVDPHDYCYPNTEGPYYVSPEHLLLRVGLGVNARYNVLVRVPSKAEADYYWYVPAIGSKQGGQLVMLPDQTGETVFAAYLWDTRTNPKAIIGGMTLREAQRRLNAFLAPTELGSGKPTRLLS